ncbi:EAL domain-containing protein [Pontibacterium granulatum]|uniref:bifunctional diguanylate cyclase/phosphodiesterase n=1 Tax=Pontibacterium granulatum TaxID=2036029 RepID=UPI00249B92A3|nr:EAL domain-containing protein [Pontibacterium granulatum]MDI3324761.1 EAL domain-containing protein [Pontibacterium granulatum]
MGNLKANRLIIYLIWGVISLLSGIVLVIYGYSVYSEQTRFEQYLQQFEDDIVSQQKARLQQETESAARRIENAYLSAKDRLKALSRNEVEKAIAQIQHLHKTYGEQMNEQELKAFIRESLRPIRFFDGRGYLFIDEMDGTSVLLPPAPGFEGHSFLADEQSNSYSVMMKILAVSNSLERNGFIDYEWNMPDNKQRTHTKISYVALYEPFNWVIGAGDYIHTFRQGIEKQIQEDIDAIRFGRDGYIAIVSADGTILKSASARHLEGIHHANMSTINGDAIRLIVESANEGAQFISYNWYRPDSNSIEEKLSYVKPLPFNGWVLVAGVYRNTLTELINEKRQELDNQLNSSLINLAVAFLIIGGLSLTSTYLFTSWLSRRFSATHSIMKKRQQLLKRRTELLELNERIVESASEGLIVTDRDAKIIHVNRAFTEITGYTRDEMLGSTPAKLSSGVQKAQFYQQLWQTLVETGSWAGEIINRRKDGSMYPQWLSINTFYGKNGDVLNYIATFSDITEQKADRAKLSYLSDYDPLTDLPNKRVMLERLNQALAHIERHKGEQTAILCIDLDHFKRINDSLGHKCGDKVIIEIARRIKGSLREVDTLSRISGDEFVVVLDPAYKISVVVTQIAFRMIEAISQVIDLPEADVLLTASIGIAIAPQDGVSCEELTKHADIALHHAKKCGRNNFQFFKGEMNETVVQRMQIENQLNVAINNREFELYYQPQHRSSDRRMSSVEALIRWQQRDGTLVSPDQFIPVSEETGQIIEIGKWVLDEACRQAAQWLAHGIVLPVSINISPVQIRSKSFITDVKRALARYSLDPHLIVLEVTETALIGDEEHVIENLNAISALGVPISLDDFGTGYSSLSLLKKMPVSEVKIDRSFVNGVPTDTENASIISSIISVAHNMSLEVVAEGVENEEQMVFLTVLNCNKIQGYYFSPAVPAAQLEALYLNKHADAVT